MRTGPCPVPAGAGDPFVSDPRANMFVGSPSVPGTRFATTRKRDGESDEPVESVCEGRRGVDQECEVCSASVPGGGLCIVCGYWNTDDGSSDADTAPDADECGFCEDNDEDQRCEICGHLADCVECDD